MKSGLSTQNGEDSLQSNVYILLYRYSDIHQFEVQFILGPVPTTFIPWAGIFQKLDYLTCGKIPELV